MRWTAVRDMTIRITSASHGLEMLRFLRFLPNLQTVTFAVGRRAAWHLSLEVSDTLRRANIFGLYGDEAARERENFFWEVGRLKQEMGVQVRAVQCVENMLSTAVVELDRLVPLT